MTVSRFAGYVKISHLPVFVDLKRRKNVPPQPDKHLKEAAKQLDKTGRCRVPWGPFGLNEVEAEKIVKRAARNVGATKLKIQNISLSARDGYIWGWWPKRVMEIQAREARDG